MLVQPRSQPFQWCNASVVGGAGGRHAGRQAAASGKSVPAAGLLGGAPLPQQAHHLLPQGDWQVHAVLQDQAAAAGSGAPGALLNLPLQFAGAPGAATRNEAQGPLQRARWGRMQAVGGVVWVGGGVRRMLLGVGAPLAHAASSLWQAGCREHGVPRTSSTTQNPTCLCQVAAGCLCHRRLTR